MKRIIIYCVFAVIFILPANAAKTKRHTLNGDISEIAISPNGEYVACGLNEKAIQLWNAQMGILKCNLPDSRNQIPLLWTQKENLLLTSLKTGIWKGHENIGKYRVDVRQMPSGKVIQSFPNMHGTIWSDGKIIRVTDGITIRVWRISDGMLLYGHLLELSSTSQKPRAPLDDLAFSPNGKFLVHEGMSYISVWDASSGKVLHKIKKAKTLASSVGIGMELPAISNDGRYLVVQGENPNWKLPFDEWGELCQRPSCYNRELTLELWDLHKHKKTRVWRGYWSGNFGATFLRFSNDNTTLYTGNHDAKSRIYNISSGKELHIPFQGIQDISQSDSFWAFGHQHVIHIISVKTGKILGRVPKQ